MATYSSIFAWRIPWTEELKESNTAEQLNIHTFYSKEQLNCLNLMVPIRELYKAQRSRISSIYKLKELLKILGNLKCWVILKCNIETLSGRA